MDVQEAIKHSANGLAHAELYFAGHWVTFTGRLNTHHRGCRVSVVVSLAWVVDGVTNRLDIDVDPGSLGFLDWRPAVRVFVDDIYQSSPDCHMWRVTAVENDQITLVREDHPDNCRCGGDPVCFTAHWVIGSLQGMRKVGYIVGKPERGGRDRDWVRFDYYVPTKNYNRVWIVAGDDLSPVFNGRYDSRCGGCWFGVAHSGRYHEVKAVGNERK